ncbi:uncharacterized protein A1O9_10379 [Exophiala aquamarina CBS 119918]|uniref:Transcription factor CBF/NF-Y/archaeal histone domain-containing protein n=1 Tax=Exophiala aquamarina CBS 119918 TaxID=1182545 RepID=A0A072NZW8_9EURO|nr:uncharacterized protein A1O9_10379 [Exophiala aquamarina CBS 119918]KEF53404.1 hypothetical protein A1O9_10379 [Exophiala aquamarina CBS 119918]
MPANNAPNSSPGSDEATGTTALPLARVKKIIAQDPDIVKCSTTATFSIAVATEIFIRYLTEQAHNVAKSERKPRRTIAYKDIATAVSRIDNLEFLSDTVPRTKTYRQFREEKAQEAAARAAEVSAGSVNSANGDVSSISIQTMMKNPQANGANGINGHGTMPGSPIAHRSAHQRNYSNPDPVRDIDMTG